MQVEKNSVKTDWNREILEPARMYVFDVWPVRMKDHVNWYHLSWMRSKLLNVFFSGIVYKIETIVKSSACLLGISSAKNESCGFKTGLTQHQKASWCASCHFLPFLVLAECSHHLTYRHAVTCILGILYCSRVNASSSKWLSRAQRRSAWLEEGKGMGEEDLFFC